MTAIIFNHLIGPVAIDVLMSENHEASIEITGVPIESGAEINDHAYIRPKRVTLDIVDGAAADTYDTLIRFQETRVPFTLTTGLRVYANMLIQNIRPRRDKTFTDVFSGSIECQEVLIVDTSTSPAQAGGQKLSPSKSGDEITKRRTSSKVRRGDNVTRTLDGAKETKAKKKLAAI